MSNNTRKLKVGIIVDNVKQPYLVNDLYQNSLRSSCYSIEALIIQNKKKIKKNFFKKIINYTKRNEFKSLIERILFEIITKIETNIIKKKIFLKRYLLIILFQNLMFRKYM